MPGVYAPVNTLSVSSLPEVMARSDALRGATTDGRSTAGWRSDADSSAATAGAGGWNGATAMQAAVPTDERRALGQGSSDKHELLLNNCSDNKRRADGRVFSANAVAGAAGYAGADGTSIAPL